MSEYDCDKDPRSPTWPPLDALPMSQRDRVPAKRNLSSTRASDQQDLARVVKDAGHPEWKVRVAMEHRCRCPACYRLRQLGTSSGQIPPVLTQASYRAWQAVGVVAAEWVCPGRKLKVKFVLFMDPATKLRVIQLLFTYDFRVDRADRAGP